MADTSYRLPNLCAWCGRRSGAELIEVQFSSGNSRARTIMKMKLPICAECREYRHWLEDVERKINMRFWLISAVVSLIPGYFMSLWMTSGDYAFGWHLFSSAICVPIVFGVVALMTLPNSRAHARIKASVVKTEHQAPVGYASTGSMPGRMVARRLEFFAPRFHSKFASLNPKLVQET